MIFGDVGAVVTIETIETGGGGSAVVTKAACSLESLATWTANSGTPSGSLGTLSRDLAETTEILLVVPSTVGAKVESLQAARWDTGTLLEWQLLVYAASVKAPTDIRSLTQREYRAPVEWSGALATVRDDLAAIGFLAGSDGVAGSPTTHLASEMVYASFASAWVRTSEVEVVIPLEWAGTTSTLEAAADTIAWIEWMENLPRPLSVDRLLRSPGRLRLLGRVSRVRVIKGI